jgi:hypothetical protein
VRTTKTLQHLGIPAVLADDTSVAAALGANSSLVHLQVHGMDESSTADFLRHLRTSHQSVLDTLQLCNGNLNSTVLEALSKFASSSTTPLSLLHLGPNIEMDAKLQTFVAAWSWRSCMIARINVGDDPKTYKPLLTRKS